MTDVITNSSTSVFVVYDKSNIQSIKDLVNSILAITSSYRFDDLFDIEFEINDEVIDYIYDYPEDFGLDSFNSLNELHAFISNMSNKEIEELWDKEYHADWDRMIQLYSGIKVTPKKEGLEKAANLISQIDTIFSLDYNYDS